MKGIIHATSGPSKFNEVLQIGFILQGNPTKWFNIQGTQEVLEDLLNKTIAKGNEISFIYDETSKKITDLKLEKAAPKKDEDVINISGKDFMTYKGLLKRAHEKKEDFSMVITESWVSEDMKMAWCKIKLTTEKQTFDGFGSSTPDNTGKMTSSHPVEMAHTRAKGRALRDYLNIGEVMAEELK